MTEWDLMLKIKEIGPISRKESTRLPLRKKQKRTRHTLLRKRLSSECVACLTTKTLKERLPTRSRSKWRTSEWPKRRETARLPGEATKSLPTRLKQPSQTTTRCSNWMEQSAELTTTDERPDEFFKEKWPSWPHLTHNKHFSPPYIMLTQVQLSCKQIQTSKSARTNNYWSYKCFH